MFTFDQLRAFVAVADEMHFGRAAERLNMTQPPLSRQVQSLERALHAELFDRTRRSIRLTAAGEAFLPEARRLLSLTAVAAETARRTALGLAGVVNVGFTATVGHFVLPSLLRRAATELPGVELVLHEMVTGDQIIALQDGTIDLGMMRGTGTDPGLESRELPAERLVAAVPRSWNLPVQHPNDDAEGALPILDLALLDGRDFVMYSFTGSRYFRDLVAAIFSLHRIKPHYVQQLTQVHTILSLVEAGMAAALVPASSRSWVSGPNTVFADAVELEAFPTESNLLWRKDSTNTALQRLLDLLGETEPAAGDATSADARR
jgi:DNA-binding transcriptional LysR family regulator